ncbi:RecX family transcriptional regulator [candidate division WOR-3 bacterium]|nr:RecX family transcriptional regulator [candidate division WOR-3 bacterium]
MNENTIESVEKNKRGWTLKIDDGSEYSTDVLFDKWKKGASVSGRELYFLKTKDETLKALEKAYVLLSYGDLTEKELSEKLLSRNFSHISVKRTVKILKRKGFLDDFCIAENMLKKFTEIKPAGGYYIKRKMKERGIEEETIRIFFEKAVSRDEFSLALAVAEKKKRRKNIVSALLNRGFSLEIARKTADTIKEEKDEHLEQPGS